MKNILKIMIIAAGAAIVCAGCKNNNDKTEAQAVEIVPLVSVAQAVSEVITDDQVYASTVEPWAKNNIVPQQGGRIEKQMAEIGDFVQAGQVLALMEDVQLQQIELQVKNDDIELARLRKLFEKGGISQSDFEAFEMACKVHRSTYNNLKRNTILTSPISGVITARNYDVGDMYAMAYPLYTVEQITPVKLLIAVSESDYKNIRKGEHASISVDALPGETFSGEITNVYPTIDPVTHTFTAEVKVKNADRKLRPGMYAKVTVTFGKTLRTIVPDVAVVKQTGSGDRFVYMLDEAAGTVSYTKVELGRRLGNRYVILSGVKPGDKVVTEGIIRLKDGIKVNVAE